MADELDFNLDSLEVFEDDQKEVLLSLLRHAEDKAEEKVKETLDDMGVTDEDLALADADPMYARDQRNLNKMRQIWKDNGKVTGASDSLTVQELVQKDVEIRDKMLKDGFSTDHPLLIPRVISEMAREAIEPNIVLTPLLQRINYSAGTQVIFPAWGAMHAADIPEGGEYPERELELAGEVTATIGKKGVAIKMSEEALRYGPPDLWSRHVNAAGRALIRWKEEKAATMMKDNAITVVSNSDVAYKSSAGRDETGARNGTLSLDDIFYAWAEMVDSGFTPNAMIIHPMAWQIFANEGIARAFGFENGQAGMMWQLAQGAPGAAPQWRMGGQNGLNQQTTVTDPGQIATTYTNLPSISPVGLSIIVSPYMEFNAGAQRSDILLVDTRELGVLVVDEEVTTEEWRDPSVDIQKVKFRERYAVAAINNGNGIRKLEDINVRAGSYDFRDKLRFTSEVYNITGVAGLQTDWGGSGAFSGDA